MKTILRFSKIVTYALFLFLYLPLGFVILNSFNASILSGTWGGWTLAWYRELLQDQELLEAFGRSIFVALSATGLCLILGTLLAFALAIYKTRLQLLCTSLIYAPLVVPEVHLGISLLMLFVALNINLGYFSIIAAHTTFCLSYVTMVMRARIEQLDWNQIEAAQDMGAGQLKIFTKVLLPFLFPALFSAALLCFTLSLDDFVVTFFVAGPQATTLPIHIYSLLKFGAPPLIHAMSTLLIVLALTIAVAIEIVLAHTRKSSKNN